MIFTTIKYDDLLLCFVQVNNKFVMFASVRVLLHSNLILGNCREWVIWYDYYFTVKVIRSLSTNCNCSLHRSLLRSWLCIQLCCNCIRGLWLQTISPTVSVLVLNIYLQFTKLLFMLFSFPFGFTILRQCSNWMEIAHQWIS